MDHDDDGGFPLKLGMSLGAFGVLLYAALALTYPLVWAALTGIIVVLASGWFTASVVLGVKKPLLLVILVPALGIGWLLFFWAVLAVQGLI